MSEPIKVLQVMGSLNRGGAESMIMNLYRAIPSDQIHFDFINHGTTEGAFSDEIEFRGGKIFSCPRYTGKNHIAYAKWWNDFFMSHQQYRIVHSHVRSTAAIFIPKAKKHGIKTIIHSHSTSNGKGIGAFTKRLLQFPLRYTADYFLGCSKEASEWLFGKKIVKSDKYYMLNNAIDISLYRIDLNVRNKYREELGIEPDELSIIHIGRFHESKNHQFIIDVFRDFHSKHNMSKLILVGEGPLKKEIQDRCKQEGLSDAVIFTGIRDDVPNLLKASDIFILPSNWEGLPVSAVEAQAAGIPSLLSDCITRDVGITELAQYLPINKSTNIWVDKIEEVSTNGQKDVSKQIIEAGFDIHQSAKWLCEFYQRIVYD